ncbi:MAG: CpaD family pilus assembly protein [Caulobacteraceae bacterium]
MTPTRLLPSAVALVLTAATLGACASASGHADKNPALQAVTPGSLFPLKVDEAKDQIALAIHAEGLSPAQAQALKDLAGRRVETGGGAVTVSLPADAASSPGAGRMDADIAAALRRLGAPVTRVAYSTEDAKAPILVSFSYDKAVIPACGKHWQDLTKTKDNTVQSNFGCAVNANIAAMIANPADIRSPRADDPADAARRMTVLGKYEDGKVTAADSPQAAPSIAHIGQ